MTQPAARTSAHCILARMRMRPWTLLALAGALPAQSAVVDHLARGDVAAAIEMLENGQAPSDAELRLRAMQLLVERAPSVPALRESALRWAAQILPDQVPARLEDDRKRVAADVGGALTRVLVKHEGILVDGRVTDRTHVGALVAARDALIAGEQRTSRDMAALALHATPILRACDRTREAIALATDGLQCTITPTQQADLSGELGLGLLTLRRFDDAIPNLQRALAADPSDPARVLPIARALPSSHALAAQGFLLPVVRKAPAQAAVGAWTECLAAYYAALDALDGKEPAAAAVLANVTERKAMPQVWNQREWGEGFRVWRDDNDRAGKIASGKDGLRVGVPQSAGWRAQARPPDDLVRWHNAAFCFQRGETTAFVVYLFGPNLEYWYGDTPRERGVTGKTVRGHSAGAIARFTWDVFYGEDAKKRGVRFTNHRRLDFALATGGQRRTFSANGVIYDETVFSHGQVTVAVLLRVAEADLEGLEPELRWLYRNVVKD